MSNSSLYRAGAWALVLSGVLIIARRTLIDFLLPLNLLTGSAGPLAVLLGLFGLTAIYLYLRDSSNRLMEIGYFINWTGLALAIGIEYARNYILPYLDSDVIDELLEGPTRFAFLTTGVTFVVGVVLFGIAIYRTQIFPRPAALLYIIGFVPYGLSPFFPDIVFRIGQLLAALGIIWFGYILLMASRQVPASKSAIRSPQPL